MKIIGTIIHGALGDCYEQLCSIKILRATRPNEKWLGFFAVKERMDAMLHFDLDMLDEVYDVNEITKVYVDEFFQFQINDPELKELVFNKLSEGIHRKFNFSKQILPWHVLRSFDYSNCSLGLKLSEVGKSYLPVCCYLNNVSDELFATRFTIGFLWRYRSKGGAINPLFQRSKEWIIKTKSDLFNELIGKYCAHIIVAGMSSGMQLSEESLIAQKAAGVVIGEHNSKFTSDKLNISNDHCTYLKGLGFAAEMEIMSRCDLLLLMPSGFSEPLWMKLSNKVLVIDPPPVYMAKIWRYRMPLFNNNKLDYALFNVFTSHTRKNVIKFLKHKNLL